MPRFATMDENGSPVPESEGGGDVDLGVTQSSPVIASAMGFAADIVVWGCDAGFPTATIELPNCVDVWAWFHHSLNFRVQDRPSCSTAEVW